MPSFRTLADPTRYAIFKGQQFFAGRDRSAAGREATRKPRQAMLASIGLRR
jgi:hypothetical protein